MGLLSEIDTFCFFAASLDEPAESKLFFSDDWFDPVMGLRGRFNLNKAILPPC